MTQPMLIQSIIRRKGGTTVTLDRTTYRFKPDASGAHTAVVSDPKHIGRFLGISEGYQLVGAAEAPESPELTGARGVRPADPKPEPEPEPAKAPEKAPEPKSEDGPGEAKALADMTDDELRKVHEDEVDRKAHPDAKRETMIARIEAARAEKAKA